MRTPTARHLPTILVAGVILVLAMAGSSAATLLITGADVKNGSLTGADVMDGSLTGTDTKNGTIASADVKDAGLGVADLSAGARKALLGAACTLPTGVAGKVAWSIGTDQVITLKCATPPTADADQDGVTPAGGDCDDTDPEVNPLMPETFSGKDDNCDGVWASGSYYTGPPGTDGTGICHAGQREEDENPPNYWHATVPEQTPEAEVLGDGLDNDCDGVVDES